MPMWQHRMPRRHGGYAGPMFGWFSPQAPRVRHLPAAAHGRQGLCPPPLRPQGDDALVELQLRLDHIGHGQYLYSKLYYATAPHQPFREDAVVCFEVRLLRCAARVQLALPAAALAAARASGHLRLRVDGLPYADGAWQLLQCRLVSQQADAVLAAEAQRRAHRQWVREQVQHSEATRRVVLPHYPESLSLELTPVCNLRCPHCSSHGMPHLHRHHNQMPEMSAELLQSLGDEAFAHASVISLVGRGEPTLASHALWQQLLGLLRQHDLRISCVSNGTRARFDADLMPWVHELIFSVDGATEATFAANRTGAHYAEVMEQMRHYHALRTQAALARRPQLTVSWTLKANNLEELPDFVDQIAPLQPDLLSIRHMVVFQDQVRDQSLLYDPERTNHFLQQAYQKLDAAGIRHESPPLMRSKVPKPGPAAPTCAASEYAGASSAPGTTACDTPLLDDTRDASCNWMHRTAIIMSDGEVITCGKHYGEQVGHMLPGQTRLWDVWNGAAMQSLRASFGTPQMWTQCRHCWLREIKWHTQRQAKDLHRDYAVVNTRMNFTPEAWDYRRFSEL